MSNFEKRSLAVRKKQEPLLENSEEQKAIRSKIKSISGYLASLLQKKYRIDLEIVKQKEVLRKLKTLNSTKVKVSVSAENFSFSRPRPSRPQIEKILNGSNSIESEERLIENYSDQILQEADNLDSFLYRN